MTVSRRKFLTIAGLAALAGPLGAGRAPAGPGIPLPPVPLPIPDIPPVIDAIPLNFSSPPLARFVTELPRIGARPAAGRLTARTVPHRYHPDLPETAALATPIPTTPGSWGRRSPPGAESRPRPCSTTRSTTICSAMPST